MKKSLLIAALCVASMASTASAGSPFGGLAGAYTRRFVGPAIRQANPYAYSALLAINRSVPPQVKNNWNNQMFNPYRGGGSPWNAELNYWRSMPPEVRNNIVRQQQMGYAAPPPQVIYVPVPATPAYPPTGAQLNAPSAVTAPPTPGYLPGAGASAAIPAPPPPSELPRIIRP